MKTIRFISICLAVALTVSALAVAPAAAEDAIYFQRFTESLRAGYGNAPDDVYHNSDYSVTFKNINASEQKQCYYALERENAKNALQTANSIGGSGKLYCTVQLESCVNKDGVPTDGEIKIWIDTKGNEKNDPQAVEWQSPGTTVTYELDVSGLDIDQVDGMYIGIMNYQEPGGIAPVVTYSPVSTEPVELDDDIIHAEFLYVENNDGTLTMIQYRGDGADVQIPAEDNGKKVTAIGAEAFNYNTKIKTVTVPDGVTTIGDYAFRYCSGLQKVTLPDSVTTIGKYAFTGCTALQSVNLTDAVRIIGDGAFLNCESLTDVHIPNQLQSFANRVFYGCKSLGEIQLPNAVKTVGALSFGGIPELKVTGYSSAPLKTFFIKWGFDFETVNGGDVNKDGKINGKDALLLRQYIARFPVTLDQNAADLTEDGKVNSRDSLLLRQYVVQCEDIIPLDPSLSDLDKQRALYTLTWSDEFDGDKLDKTKWGYEGSSTHRNNELQTYCDLDSERNVYLEDGNMVIEARKENRNGYQYTSGSVHTKRKHLFQYGMFEISARLPKGKGVWPAFWLLGVDPRTGNDAWPRTGELDILEMIGGEVEDSTAHGTIHTTDENGNHISQGSSMVLDSGTFNDAFHTFGVIWTETEVYWYVDETIYFYADMTDPNYDKAFNTYEAYIIINLAIGGSWAGTPAATTKFPARYYIDYVRVYQ